MFRWLKNLFHPQPSPPPTVSSFVADLIESIQKETDRWEHREISYETKKIRRDDGLSLTITTQPQNIGLGESPFKIEIGEIEDMIDNPFNTINIPITYYENVCIANAIFTSFTFVRKEKTEAFQRKYRLGVSDGIGQK